jgi:hypothetical protein
MKKTLPPNFKDFFNRELKRWTSGAKPALGTNIGHELEEMVTRAKKAIQKDIDEKEIAEEIIQPVKEEEVEDRKIIKESGSKHPIK